MVEVINRDGKWFVREDDHERMFPTREQAVKTAKGLTRDDVPVIHERSAHVRADLSFK